MHAVGILQWNVNGFCICIPELVIMQRRYVHMFQQQFVCKKHTFVLLIPPTPGSVPHTGMIIWLVTELMVVLLSLSNAAYIPVWFSCKVAYNLLLYAHSWWLSHLQSPVCTTHHTLLLPWQIYSTTVPATCSSCAAQRL